MMSIMRWDPLGEISSLRNQMNRFFDQTFRKSIVSGSESFGPRVDLFQTDAEVVATAEIPGVASKDDIEVSVTQDSLSLRGVLKRSHDIDEENYFHSERYFGSFSRTLPLPAEVKPEETKAVYQNGLLEIRMPKSEKGLKNSYRIPIQ
ncbi:Hsp20/alpha crystallin family protein [Pelotomaculum propionicicum]|uniref:Spore protein SP21 n=1 Tax=Pelotomaculum propionicicum TaxID=258475 RepID=A0A4Y7RUZ9_9FIRM|nr:Hsp20/alpha crystallin family protein [Pelotomaculum propionicicum]TEB12559.1 Spore protein SP21 [Pelotomaculum propionicicum]